MKTILTFCFLLPCLFLFAQIQIGDDIDGDFFNQRFGDIVEISANGKRIAVSSFSDKRIKVFDEIMGSWTKVGNDIFVQGFGQSNSYFSLSSNGKRIAIGKRINNLGNTEGQVSVFEEVAGIWIQVGSDIANVHIDDGFGFSVSLSEDGKTMAVGAPSTTSTNPNPNFVGFVDIYKEVSGNWVLNQRINGDNAGDRFGWSVVLSDNGKRVAVGAPEYDNPNGYPYGYSNGQVKLFEENNGNWAPIMMDPILGHFDYENVGEFIAFSSDGKKVAIGRPNKITVPYSFYPGEVVFFYEYNNFWYKAIETSDYYVNYFGRAVSLSGDGAYYAIGVEITPSYTGEYIKTNRQGNNIQDTLFVASAALDVKFSKDGNRIVIGEASTNGNTGKVRVYSFDLPLNNNDITRQKHSFHLFPNPNNGTFTIDLKEFQTQVEVTITSITGQIIQTETFTNVETINLSVKLPAETYFLTVKTEDGETETIKMVKN